MSLQRAYIKFIVQWMFKVCSVWAHSVCVHLAMHRWKRFLIHTQTHTHFIRQIQLQFCSSILFYAAQRCATLHSPSFLLFCWLEKVPLGMIPIWKRNKKLEGNSLPFFLVNFILFYFFHFEICIIFVCGALVEKAGSRRPITVIIGYYYVHYIHQTPREWKTLCELPWLYCVYCM